MNNSNGAALLASLRPGALVTIRTESGQRYHGRAERATYAPHAWQIRDHSAHVREVTAANLVRVHP